MWKHHRNRPSSKNGTLKQVGGDPSVEESWKKGQFRIRRTWSLPSQDSGAGKVCLVGPAVRHPKIKDVLDRGPGLEAVLCDPVHFPNFSDEKN